MSRELGFLAIWASMRLQTKGCTVRFCFDKEGQLKPLIEDFVEPLSESRVDKADKTKVWREVRETDLCYEEALFAMRHILEHRWYDFSL